MWEKIYVNGCSFSDGYGLDIPEYLEVLNKYNPKYPIHTESKETLNNFRKNNSWPGVLESLINIPIVNEASFGGSFERVIRMSFDYISKQSNPSDTLFIFDIPNAERYDWWSASDDTFKKVTHISGEPNTSQSQNGELFNPSEVDTIQKFYKFFGDDKRKWLDELRSLIFFCSFLKSKNIDFIIIPTEQLLYAREITDLKRWEKELKFIDEHVIRFEVPQKFTYSYLCVEHQKRNVDYTENPLVFYQDYHKQTFKDETNGELDDTHPNLEGCRLMAHQIYENIKNKYIKV